MGVGDQLHATVPLSPEKTRYALYRRLGGPQGRSGRVRKISAPPPPGFDPRTVQPVPTALSHEGTVRNVLPLCLTSKAQWLLYVPPALTVNYSTAFTLLLPSVGKTKNFQLLNLGVHTVTTGL